MVIDIKISSSNSLENKSSVDSTAEFTQYSGMVMIKFIIIIK